MKKQTAVVFLFLLFPALLPAGRGIVSVLNADQSFGANAPIAAMPADPGTLNSLKSAFFPFVETHAELLLSVILVLLLILLVLEMERKNLKQVRWAMGILSVCLGVRYLVWRGLATLNTDSSMAMAISLTLYLAEVYGFIGMLLFYLQVMRPVVRSAAPHKDQDLPTVDVFVAIYNEPPEVLYRTLVGCTSLDYPAGLLNIYVLDDGGRLEIRQMAENLGCHYITRDNNEHAKAGNINNALTKTHGEFVLFLDCDHVPVRSFLKETIGFFKDPTVGVVQTPHHFYNADIFQRNFKMEHELVNDQDLFFNVILPGRDGFNASFFAGSCGVMRRSALAAAGGFPIGSVTEDIHASLIMHSKGYRSIYLRKPLSAGLAPENYHGFVGQRQRWTKGSIQVLFLDNPLTKRGLSFMQRIMYFSSIYYFFHGWARLVFLVAPLSYLLLNLAPLKATVPSLLSNFAPYYVSFILAFALISRRFRNPFWSDIYETAMSFFIGWSAFAVLFVRKVGKFYVTSKGGKSQDIMPAWYELSPHIVVATLLVAGIFMGIYRLENWRTDYNTVLLSVYWSLYNLAILGGAIVVALTRPEKRVSPRISRRIRCELVNGSRMISGKTLDISEGGLAIVLDRNIPLTGIGKVRLCSEFEGTLELKAEVVRNDAPEESRTAMIGIRFAPLTEAQRRSVLRHIFSAPNAWRRVRRPLTSPLDSFVKVLACFLRGFIRDQVMRRFSPRFHRESECELIAEGQVFRGLMKDISRTGMRVKIERQLPRSRPVEVRLRMQGGETFQVQGEVVRRLKDHGEGITLGIRFAEGIGSELMALV